MLKKTLLRPTGGFHGRLRWGSAEFIKRAKNKNRARVFKKDSIYLLFSRGIKKHICILITSVSSNYSQKGVYMQTLFHARPFFKQRVKKG